MVAYDFSAGDIFKLAVEIEKNGAEFYRKSAESVTEEEYRNLLLNLAAMEEQHEKVFSQMAGELSAMDNAETVFDPDGEAALYLKALADIRVFFDKPIDTGSMESILKAAITAEKDSIVLYLGMKELVPEKFGKGRIDGIIKEEMGHIRLLSGELKKVKSRG